METVMEPGRTEPAHSVPRRVMASRDSCSAGRASRRSTGVLAHREERGLPYGGTHHRP